MLLDIALAKQDSQALIDFQLTIYAFCKFLCYLVPIATIYAKKITRCVFSFVGTGYVFMNAGFYLFGGARCSWSVYCKLLRAFLGFYCLSCVFYTF